MTREEEIRNAIDTIFPIPPYEKGRKYEQALMATGFEGGVKWADEHPKSPWISVKEDLPYKHKELLSSDHETKLVLTVDACGSINTDFMSIYEGTWCWWNDSNTVYWHPISDFDKNLL